MSSSNSPCAACKFLRRKCTPGCVFAPYFPPDQPVKFANVHKVFGASNVAKLLNELAPAQREDAVNSLAYEAEARLHDPVYGCVGYISLLQHRLIQLQRDLSAAKKELSAYIGPAALGPFLPHHQFHAPAAQPIMPGLPVPAAMGMGMGFWHGNHQSAVAMHRDNHLHQQMEAQQLAEAVAMAREQEMLRSMEQQQEMSRLNAGGGFGQVGDGSDAVGVGASGEAPRPLTLISPQICGFEGSFLVQQQQQQLEMQFHEAPHGHRLPHHQRRGSDEGRSDAGPSS